jgi:hypothetical protein
MYSSWFLTTLLAAMLLGSAAAVAPDEIMNNLFLFWNAFRDPKTGLFCDTMSLNNDVVCGDHNNRYSSASTGMGLVADCAFVEMGLLERAKAKERALQTVGSLSTKWPTEKHSGCFVHQQ